MKDELTKGLFDPKGDTDADRGVERILAAAFFRTRPLQAGAAPVVHLDDRRGESSPRR